MSTVALVSHVGLWLFVLALSLLTFALSRQIGLLHTRIRPVGAMVASAGPEIGSLAPQLTLPDTRGREVTVGGPRPVPLMLVFMQPSCSTCSVIAPALRAAARQERGEVEVVLASLSTDQQMNDAFIEAEKLDELTFLASDALAHAYKVTMPPYAVVVGTDGTVKTKGVVNNREHLESLLVATKLGHPTRHVPAALKQAAV